MKSLIVDTSKNWVGIIVGEESTLRILNFELKKRLGRTVHMRELRRGEKISVLNNFNKLFSGSGVELHSIEPSVVYSFLRRSENWWSEFIKWVIKRGISTLYVDSEVREELKKRTPLSFKTLNIYLASKEQVQCADTLAYGDSHHKLARHIWKDIQIKRGELQ